VAFALRQPTADAASGWLELMKQMEHVARLHICDGREKGIDMPVLAKCYGVVIRFIYDGVLGTRLHASYGDLELVVALKPLRVVQGDVPEWVRDFVLGWARQHYAEFPTNRPDWQFCARNLALARPPLAHAN
jgi:hypothetical protein